MNTREEFFLCKQFREDPFATTNALQEKYLEECFIQPSYYMSLLGSVKNPRSSFVTAPRGTGKTAQRVMLERFAKKENGTLAVVYDDFPIEECSDIRTLKLEEHLVRIMKILIISFLSEIHRKQYNIMLDSYEKKQLKSLIEVYLSGINSREVASSINKIKGLSGRLEDIWCKAGKSITSVINMILAKNDMGNIKLDNIRKNNTFNIEDIKSHYDFVEKLYNSIGITAVYILVDSIDETALTGNNAEKSYYLIRPFVLDLLNWETNEVPLNIGGYKYDKKTKTFPVFINYDKSEDISDTTKYEDHFTSSSSLIAISKSGRSIVSEDVQNFLHATERGIQVHLFVRKNKDDKISKEFYYLGHMQASGQVREFVMPNTDKTAVEIEWLLDVPVREDLYEYMVNG